MAEQCLRRQMLELAERSEYWSYTHWEDWEMDVGYQSHGFQRREPLGLSMFTVLGTFSPERGYAVAVGTNQGCTCERFYDEDEYYQCVISYVVRYSSDPLV